jgi:hypothetical protein
MSADPTLESMIARLGALASSYNDAKSKAKLAKDEEDECRRQLNALQAEFDTAVRTVQTRHAAHGSDWYYRL